MVEKSVKQALSDIAGNPTGYAILDLAEQFFCTQTQTNSEGNQVTKYLIDAFCDSSRSFKERFNAGVLCLDIF